MTQSAETQATEVPPFVAPCRRLSVTAPFGWLRQGWADIRRAPRLSLRHGEVMALLAAMMSGLAWYLGSFGLVLAVLSGIIFLGPILAIGLYSISAALERGQQPTMRRALRAERRHFGTEAVFALVLLVVFLLWARAASIIHIFYPDQVDAGWAELAGYWVVGSLVGGFFLAIIFALSAFSLPMIVHRDVDAVTAVVSSVNAVLRNKRAMLVWGILIMLAVLIGIVTFLFGFIITLPLIAHATWHGYLETIDASGFPRHREGVTATARQASGQ